MLYHSDSLCENMYWQNHRKAGIKMKRLVTSMLAMLSVIIVPSAYAANDSDYKPVKIAPKYYVIQSTVESPFPFYPGEAIALPMTKDDKWYQKRIPLIDDVMDTGLGYRVPDDAVVRRKRAITDTVIGPLPSYIDTIETKNYTATFKFYAFADKPYLDLVEETDAKYGGKGWKDYYIENSISFSEKITKNSIVVRGSTATATTTFELRIVSKKGKKLQAWWAKNIMQGLEIFILKQQFHYVESGDGAGYISEMLTQYIDPEIVLPNTGEFTSNEYYPGGEVSTN